MHSSPYELQGMMPQVEVPQYMKHQTVQASIPTQDLADQLVPSVLENMMNRSNTLKLMPSPTEASLLSLVDQELRVSSISNLSIFLKLLPRCKTEPEQTLGLIVLRATSTASNTNLSHACASTFEKNGGLRLARTWVDSAVTWEHNDLLVLLLEVLQTLPLQLTSITEARINEPIVKLRKHAADERVKRTAQDLLKFWRSKFTEKERASMPSSVATENKAPDITTSSSSSTTLPTKSSSSLTMQAFAKPVQPKQLKVIKKRAIKRLERLPFGGGSAVSKSSDLIGNLMLRKSAKDAAAKTTSKSLERTDVVSSDAKVEVSLSPTIHKETAATISSHADPLSIPLPTIQSFKVATTSSTALSGERKRIRWADEKGKELVQVKLIESWRDLVPFDPRHDDQSFKDAKLREHANERHALLAQHHKVPPAVAIAQSREWTTPVFIRLPQAVATRVYATTVTDEMRVQESRRRHVDEYEVLVGEMPIQSPKEWERLNEPLRGPPLEIPLCDAVETEASNPPPLVSAPVSAPLNSAVPNHNGREAFSAGRFGQNMPGYTMIDSNAYTNRPSLEADRKLREALGPLQETTVALMLDNPDVVPQVLEEAQRHGNRIPDARVYEIVEQYRRGGRFQIPPNAGGLPAYSPYGSQQQHQFGGFNAGYERQYQQHFPMQQVPPGGPFMPVKRKADAMGSIQSGLLPESFNRPVRKRGTMPCRFFNSPMGCKNGDLCHYAHVQPAPSNGPELSGIYNNNGRMMVGRGGAGPIMGGRGPPVHMEPYGAALSHHMRGGR